MAKRKQMISGQRDLFEEDRELTALRETERKLDEAHREMIKLPAKLEREIKDRYEINRFEQSLSRGQIENVLRTQRHSFFLMVLLFAATALMLGWAYRIVSF
jgi:hypothetical protein